LRNTGLCIAVAAAGLLLSACGVPHSDVMLFGTDTKLALDVSAPPEMAGTPQIVLGYKRREFVLMPLLANGEKSKVVANANQGAVADAKYVGSTGAGDLDTYSVLASFGAEFDSQAGAGEAKAGGGLAQYFATGMAARILAERGGANLVRTNTVDDIPPDVRARAAELVAQVLNDTDEVVAFVSENDAVKACRIAQLLDGTSLAARPATVARFNAMAGKPAAEFRRMLDTRYKANVKELAANIKDKGGC